MSCPSFQVKTGLPIYSLGFTSKNQLIIGGGGGISRSGVKNRLTSFKIDIRRKDLEEDATFEFEADEDAPMCLDVHPTKPTVVTGVNASEKNIKKGINDSCRAFKVFEDKFELEKAVKTVESQDPIHFQKVVRFSEDGMLVATGTTDGKVNVFKYPSFESVSSGPITLSEVDDVLDVDINLEKEKLTCVLRDGLKLVNLRGKNVGQIVQTISSSTITKGSRSEFRAFRYGRGYTKDFGFAVVNGIAKPSAYIVKYDAYSLDQLKAVKVGNSPITSFTLSQDGAVLAYASADLSITVMDAMSLKTLTKIKGAHGFSITCISISPDRRLIASGSAEGTCCIVSLPIQFPTGLIINPLYTLLLACLVAGILLWITTIVDIQPFFKPEINDTSSSMTTTNLEIPTTTTTATTTTTTIESIVSEIAAETPLVTLTETEILEESTNRDEL